MTVAISTDTEKTGWLKIDIVGNGTAAGIVGSVANPEGKLLHIYDGFLYVKTGASAASTFDIGIGTLAADSSNLVSALAVNATNGTVWKVVGSDLASEAAATTPKGVLWSETNYLNITSAANASTGLTASLYLKYIRLG